MLAGVLQAAYMGPSDQPDSLALSGLRASRIHNLLCEFFCQLSAVQEQW